MGGCYAAQAKLPQDALYPPPLDWVTWPWIPVCAWQGALPDALGNLTALTQLVLRGNALTGPLPAWVAVLPALRAAWLGDNNFSGPVPAAWCSSGSANISVQARPARPPV